MMDTASQRRDFVSRQMGVVGGGLLKHLDVMTLFAPSVAFGGQLSVSVNLPNLIHNSS